ncbi:MAG TPA: aldolase/citrate lyase family protein, partial [Candidatus Lustribacter sp.]|nr:aldolase/citrate lyase family protein [Candidatus Lustribacter sp.]
DLEDAVAAGEKSAARSALVDWVHAGGRPMVRVNACGTPWYDADVAVCAEAGVPVLLPKSDDPGALADLVTRLGAGARVIPLVETARGVEHALALACEPGVVRLALGALDLAAEVGFHPADREALLYTRSRLASASAAAGLAGPVDGVTTGVADAAGAVVILDGRMVDRPVVARAQRLLASIDPSTGGGAS